MMQRVQESPINRRHFVGGSDARVIMGQDEKALIRLWQEKRGNVAPAPTRRMGRNPANYLRPGFFTNCDLRKRTPAPPPLLSMNSIPAASNAWLRVETVNSSGVNPLPAVFVSSAQPHDTVGTAPNSTTSSGANTDGGFDPFMLSGAPCLCCTPGGATPMCRRISG